MGFNSSFEGLNERLKKSQKIYLENISVVFVKNGSTSDQIFIISQMIEKRYEHNQDLHMLFVDLNSLDAKLNSICHLLALLGAHHILHISRIRVKQAFDSIDVYKLYQVMEGMKIPYKLIGLVKMTITNTTARAKVTNKLSNSFTFNAGVRQGDGLSTALFILALHYGVQKIDQRGTIFTELSQICACADDIVIVARTQKKTNCNVSGLRRGNE
jgi:hypothetical protein